MFSKTVWESTLFSNKFAKRHVFFKHFWKWPQSQFSKMPGIQFFKVSPSHKGHRSKAQPFTFIIVLSFAPSVAAGWHCDRTRITYESNSVRHSVFFKRWVRQFVFLEVLSLLVTRCGACTEYRLFLGTVPPMLSPKMCLLNKTDCTPFFGTVPPISTPTMF